MLRLPNTRRDNLRDRSGAAFNPRSVWPRAGMHLAAPRTRRSWRVQVNDRLETQFLTVFQSNPESVVKRKAKYETLRRAPNVSDVRHHFAGQSCLVTKPALPDGKCVWACIDVDVYD